MRFNVRFRGERLGTLVLIGARADGQKELIAVEEGDREYGELKDGAARSEAAGPVLAVGSGAF